VEATPEPLEQLVVDSLQTVVHLARAVAEVGVPRPQAEVLAIQTAVQQLALAASVRVAKEERAGMPAVEAAAEAGMAAVAGAVTTMTAAPMAAAVEEVPLMPPKRILKMLSTRLV
jgi:hypothetical protein